MSTKEDSKKIGGSEKGAEKERANRAAVTQKHIAIIDSARRRTAADGDGDCELGTNCANCQGVGLLVASVTASSIATAAFPAPTISAPFSIASAAFAPSAFSAPAVHFKMSKSSKDIFFYEQKLVFGDYTNMGVPRDDRKNERD
eukprot:jgi/Chrpa1/19043/Chrysochromulina_OHIO_Genome00024641-RA